MLAHSPTPSPATGNMLYDSERFVVVHLGWAGQNGFEIVDKTTKREVFLTADWSAAFQRQISAWQADIPSQDQVEEVLEGYAELAQLPLVSH